MTETVEKKLPVRNLERIGELKFRTYEEANASRERQRADKNIVKLKIFARSDGSFDLVGYKKIEPKKAEPKKAEEVPAEAKPHGLKSKDRKRDPRKK